MATPSSPVLAQHQEPLAAPALLPLAGAQPGIWYAHHLEGERSSSYNVARYARIDGELNPDVLVEAVRRGLAGVDTLGFRFGEVAGAPMQWQEHTGPEPLEVMDLRAGGEDAAREAMAADLATEVSLTGDEPLSQAAVAAGGGEPVVLVPALPPHPGGRLQLQRHHPAHRGTTTLR